METPLVDVVIPHLDDAERLAECLALLGEQSYPAERFRVIVVDNGSQRPLDALIARFPGVVLAEEAEKGCGSARNRGAALSTGDVLAFTDSDCRPDRDWLTNGVRRLTHHQADIVGGGIAVFAADEARPTDAELFDKVFGFEQERYVRRKSFAAGANIMVPRSVFAAVGPFRNGQLPEDLEWGRRAAAMGFRIGFAADAVIRHPARRTWSELARKIDRTTWHARNYMAERPWFRLRWAAYTAAMATPPLWKATKILASPALSGWGQRWRTLRTLVRVRTYRVGRMLGYLVEG